MSNSWFHKFVYLFLAFSLLLSACTKSATPPAATATVIPTETATPVVTPEIVPQGTQIMGGDLEIQKAFKTAVYNRFYGSGATVCTNNNGTVKGFRHEEKGISVRHIWFQSDDSPIYMLVSNGDQTELWAMGAVYGFKDFTTLATSVDEINAKYPDVANFLNPVSLTINCDPGTPAPAFYGYDTLTEYDIYFIVASTYYVTGRGMKYSCMDKNQNFFEYGEYTLAGETYKVWHYAPGSFANHIIKVESFYDTRYFKRLETDIDWHYASSTTANNINELILNLPSEFICSDAD